MDAQGVAVTPLSLMPRCYWGDGDLGSRLARIVNDAMAEASRRIPNGSFFLPRYRCKILKPPLTK